MKKKRPDQLSEADEAKIMLVKAQLEEINDVQRHRREIEQRYAEQCVEHRRANDAHAAHVAATEARHAEAVRLLADILSELKAMRLEAKPPLVWWPVSPNNPGPLMPQHYRDPITCDGLPHQSTGTKTEC